MLTEKDYCDYGTCHELMMMGLEPSVHYDSCHSLLLYEAQKWLREERKISVIIDRDSVSWYYALYVLKNDTYEVSCSGSEFDSYEEALSEGLREAVKILREK